MYDLYQDATWVTPSKQALEDALADLLNALEQLQEAVGAWLDLLIQYTAENPSNTKGKRSIDASNPSDSDIANSRTTAINLGSPLRMSRLLYVAIYSLHD